MSTTGQPESAQLGPDLAALDEVFPLNEEERQRFIRDKLRPLRRRPWEISDRRLRKEYGQYSSDPGKSSWRSREANRYVTELQRLRELKPVYVSIWVAIALGLIAVSVAILAIPLKDSVFEKVVCGFSRALCS